MVTVGPGVVDDLRGSRRREVGHAVDLVHLAVAVVVDAGCRISGIAVFGVPSHRRPSGTALSQIHSPVTTHGPLTMGQPLPMSNPRRSCRRSRLSSPSGSPSGCPSASWYLGAGSRSFQPLRPMQVGTAPAQTPCVRGQEVVGGARPRRSCRCSRCPDRRKPRRLHWREGRGTRSPWRVTCRGPGIRQAVTHLARAGHAGRLGELEGYSGWLHRAAVVDVAEEVEALVDPVVAVVVDAVADLGCRRS